MALADSAPRRKGGYQKCGTCAFMVGLSPEDAAALTAWLADDTYSAASISDRIASDPDYAEIATPGQSSIGKHRREHHGAV